MGYHSTYSTASRYRNSILFCTFSIRRCVVADHHSAECCDLSTALAHHESMRSGALTITIFQKYFKDVSCEFDEFRVDTHHV